MTSKIMFSAIFGANTYGTCACRFERYGWIGWYSPLEHPRQTALA